MAFPTIRSHNSTLSPIYITSIAYPSSILPGDTLILIVYVGADGITTPSGWDRITTPGTEQFQVFTKIANGAESGSITVSKAAFGFMASVDAGSGYTYAATSKTTATDTVDSPSLTPGAGLRDYLWFSGGLYAAAGDAMASPTAPSGFTMILSTTDMAIAYREYTGSVLDPAAFGDSDSTTGAFYTFTVAVYYASRGNALFFGSNF